MDHMIIAETEEGKREFIRTIVSESRKISRQLNWHLYPDEIEKLRANNWKPLEPNILQPWGK